MTEETLNVANDKRVLNEFATKILNEERADRVHKLQHNLRLSDHAPMQFRCECDDRSCSEYIVLSSEEYTKVHSKTRYFIVVPAHIQGDIEEVISMFHSYALVSKFFPGAAKG